MRKKFLEERQMGYPIHIVDVFTDRALTGNLVRAVFEPDVDGALAPQDIPTKIEVGGAVMPVVTGTLLGAG